jgi:hypothetical protein
VDSEPVISFYNKGRSILGGLPFCIFVRNTVYVIEVEMLESAILARYLESRTSIFSSIHSHPSPPPCDILQFGLFRNIV